MKRKSFTLAEVLVTIMIIGIVASMTIPGILKNYEEQETVSQLLKSYSIFRQATLMITADCDGNILNCISNPDATNDNLVALNDIATLYKAKLKVVKDCNTETGCFFSGEIKLLNDTKAWEQDNQTKTYKMILSDGMSVAFDWNGWSYFPTALFILNIDLNGKKQPNQFGRDIFQFAYNYNTGDLEPGGKNIYKGACSPQNTGYGCAQKVLLERAINY